jgi:hypothetical protein
MSTNVEALITRNLGWLSHGHLGRTMDPLLSCLLKALSWGRSQGSPESNLMRLHTSSQTSNRGWAGTMPPGFKEI